MFVLSLSACLVGGNGAAMKSKIRSWTIEVRSEYVVFGLAFSRVRFRPFPFRSSARPAQRTRGLCRDFSRLPGTGGRSANVDAELTDCDCPEIQLHTGFQLPELARKRPDDRFHFSVSQELMRSKSKIRSEYLGAKAVHTESAAKVRFGRFWDSGKKRTASQNRTQHCGVLTGKRTQQDRKKDTASGGEVYDFRFFHVRFSVFLSTPRFPTKRCAALLFPPPGSNRCSLSGRS